MINETLAKHDVTFKLKVNYFEIYNEQFNDLLSDQQSLKLREQKDGSILVIGANTMSVACPEDIFELLMIG
jgi:hypothetical protein